MAITNEFARVPLDQILIIRDERQRKDINVDDIIGSIKARGVLQPIIIERDLLSPPYKLRAGERRYTASLQLGLPDIPARFVEDLSPIELSIIELEENIKRQDLPWQDIVRAVGSIHRLYAELTSDWTMGETADALGLNKSTVSIYMRVESAIAEERIATASTVREAYNILARRDQRSAGDAIEQLLGLASTDETPVESFDEVAPITQDAYDQLLATDQPSPGTLSNPTSGGSQSPILVSAGARPSLADQLNPAKSILQESFLHWAPKYSGQKFNLIHCDFPYGVNLFDGSQAGDASVTKYDDTLDTYKALVQCLCTNLDRLMSVSGHLMFWYSARHHDLTMAMFRELAPSLVFYPFPLIWLKSDNAGIASDPRRHPRHVYETCLLATRGGRHILKVVADAYSAPTDKRWHVSTKPEPVLKHFMTMLVDGDTTLLDPTCGSGSAIRVAEELGAKRVLGMDIDESTVGNARQALRAARMLRSASKTVRA